MTLREQRAIVYPPNYNPLIDEWWLYETDRNKTKIIFLLLVSTIGLCIKYAFYEIKKDIKNLFYN